jgi:hypothetical protein
MIARCDLFGVMVFTTSMATATPHNGSTTTQGAGRLDQPGRLQGDNDIVEQYNNPTELALSRAPG